MGPLRYAFTPWMSELNEILLNKNDRDLKYILESEATILTPHIAGWTEESNIKISNIVSEKILNITDLYIGN